MAAEEIIRLGAIAHDCEHWEPLAGFLDLNGARCVEPYRMEWQGAHPDLRDPATRGCVLELVRRARRASDASAQRVAQGWVVIGTCIGDRDKSILGSGPSEAWALVSALVGADEH